jgi:hypothetical protein
MLRLMPDPSLANRLLDAQVAWLVGRLTGPDLPELIAHDVDDLLAAGARLRLADLVDAEEIKALIRQLFEEVPPSVAASTLVEAAADVAHSGPTASFSMSDLIDREHVERLVDEAFGMTDLGAIVLDRLTESPLVAGLASRFVARIVNDVVQSNRALAEKIPGVGSLVSFGASAAGRVIGAADKQFEQVLGDTAGKGAVFVMRRLNKIVIETLKDPATRRAALEVFDLYADQPVTSLNQISSREDARRVAGLLQDIVITGARTDPVLAVADALVDRFFTIYGEHPPTELLDELGITRDNLVEHATALAPRLLAAAHESGELELLLRSRLEPFFGSPEVAAILGA